MGDNKINGKNVDGKRLKLLSVGMDVNKVISLAGSPTRIEKKIVEESNTLFAEITYCYDGYGTVKIAHNKVVAVFHETK